MKRGWILQGTAQIASRLHAFGKLKSWQLCSNHCRKVYSFTHKAVNLGLLLGFGLGACTANPDPMSVPAKTPRLTPSPSMAVSPASQTLSPTPDLSISATSTPSLSPTSSPLSITPSASPSPPPPTPLLCWQEGGRVEHEQLNSDLLPLPLFFRVYTPPCYENQPEARYPVLYLLHGQSYTDEQWDRLGADEVAEELIVSGEISPFLIVMPRHRYWSQPAENPFDEVFVNELIPWVDAHYRTRDEREFRAIGGLSWGGNWAVHIGLTHWDIFGAIGAHSTPAFSSEGPPWVRERLESIPPEQIPSIFMDVGRSDYLLEETMRLEETLYQAGVVHEWHLYPGYHDEAYWSAHVEEYVRWYAKGW